MNTKKSDGLPSLFAFQKINPIFSIHAKKFVYNKAIMIKPSTFSIVAYDRATDSWGVAVASKFLAVGSVVPWLKAGCGAIATQSYANTTFGFKGLELLGQGFTAEEVFNQIAATDPLIEKRQVGIVDAKGNSYTFTGNECFDWAGGLSDHCYAIQGNTLANNDVVQSMEDAYLSSVGDLADRLFAALWAGESAGGDKRGKQSAAIKIVKQGAGYGGFTDTYLDFRVDNDMDPLPKLAKMLELRQIYYGTSDEAEKLTVDEKMIEKLTSILVKRKLLKDPDSNFNVKFNAFVDFIGYENFEDRFDQNNKTLDEPVYEYILRNY